MHAVRQPANMRLPEGVRQVSIRIKGKELIFAPIGRTRDSFFLNDPQVSDDFLPECAGQFQQAREAA